MIPKNIEIAGIHDLPAAPIWTLGAAANADYDPTEG